MTEVAGTYRKAGLVRGGFVYAIYAKNRLHATGSLRNPFFNSAHLNNQPHLIIPIDETVINVTVPESAMDLDHMNDARVELHQTHPRKQLPKRLDPASFQKAKNARDLNFFGKVGAHALRLAFTNRQKDNQRESQKPEAKQNIQ